MKTHFSTFTIVNVRKLQRMTDFDFCVKWLKLNGFKEKNEGDHVLLLNDTCTIYFSMLFKRMELRALGEFIAIDDFNVYWLLGVLTYHNHLSKPFVPVRELCQINRECTIINCKYTKCTLFKPSYSEK